MADNIEIDIVSAPDNTDTIVSLVSTLSTGSFKIDVNTQPVYNNIEIDVITTPVDTTVEVIAASASSIGIEYFYPQGPAGTGASWGSITGTISAQPDLWSYLSGGVTGTVSIPQSANWDTAYTIATAYSSLSSSLVTDTALKNSYLPLSGGTLTGTVNFTRSVNLSEQLSTFANISSLNSLTYITGNKAGYGLYVTNQSDFDPGTPFIADGRARVVHGMTFQAGITNFANNSDHSHVQWSSQNRWSWQMIQNGGTSSTNRNTFLLNSVGNQAAVSYFNESQIHSIDTTTAVQESGFPYTLNNVKINYNTNTPVLSSNQFVQVTFNPGMVGLIANTYSGVVNSGPTPVTINGTTKYQYDFSLDLLLTNNWNSTQKGYKEVFINNASGAKSVRVATSPGSISGIQTGLSGNYLNVSRYVLVGIQGHNAYEGESVVLRILGEAKINLTVTSYNAYVKKVIDANSFVISVGNAVNGWSNTSGIWNSGNNWTVYKGSTDPAHQYTPALYHFYFQRFPTSDTSTTTTGGNRVVALGNSADVDGDFSYALGHKSSVFSSHGAILGGEDNLVQGDYSTAVGGIGLVASGTNQFIIGKYNAPDTSANKPLIVGWGASDKNRSNILELSSSGALTLQGPVYALSGNSNQWNSAYSTTTAYTAISSTFIQSNTTSVPSASAVRNIITLTPEAYSNLSIRDANTLYIIV